MKDPRYPFALDEGTEIGGYRIDKVLGAGGFGITYRGYNDITEKQVAIKEFYVREISSREGATVVVDQDVESGTYEYALKKFQEEAQSVVTRFQHRYIIRGENFVRAHNTCYLIMEYIDGGNLDDWLVARRTPPAEAEIRPFFEKLFQAVDYVHQNNMMHRDLTPRNIMVRTNGDPVLIDFGAAGLGIDLGRSSKIVAQLRYAPPEQSDETASGVHGRYTDVFSLAGVLFRTVTGRTPMAPTSRLTRMRQARDDHAADPQGPVASLVANPGDFSPTFLAGIDLGLQLDERLRPQSIAAFRVALGWGQPGDMVPEPAAADAVTAILPPIKRPQLSQPTPLPLTRLTAAVEDPEATRAIAIDRTPPITAPLQTATASPTEREPVTPAPDRRRKGGVIAAIVAVIVIAAAGGIAAQNQAQIRAWVDGLAGPAVVTPYRFGIQYDGHTVTLAGFVPDEAMRATVRAAISAALPATLVDDRLALGRGQPATLAASVAAFTRHLPEMAHGSIDITGDKAALTATAATPAAYGVLDADLGRLAADGHGSLALTPATVSPYTFSLSVRGTPLSPLVTLTGYLPDGAARATIAAALAHALPGVHTDDRTDIAAGAPADLAAAVAFLTPRLANLDRADLTLTSLGIRLEGSPRDPQRLAEAAAPIDPAGVPGHLQVTLAIAPLTVSPYVFTASASEGMLTLSGFVPDQATRQAAIAVRPDLRVVDRLGLADGAPDNMADAIRFAVTEAAMLEIGNVTITDRTIDIAGTIARVADVTALKTEFNRHRPNGFSIGQASYGLREGVPAQDCDRLALPPDHQDKPAEMIGVALQGIDAATAIPACRKAVEVFPNVRRFVTALGAALQAARNDADAVAQYRLAAEADDATAMALLGIMLRDGRGQPADPIAANDLLDRAAKANNGTALFAIGQAYLLGQRGPGRDRQEAIKWYTRAASHDSAEANFALGTFALNGQLRGTPDMAAAYGFFEKAAQLGLPIAMQSFARMIELGQSPGHGRDYGKAFEWYTRAATFGDTVSMMSLARLYLDGLGVVADPVKARMWLTKLADAGNSDAMLRLGQLDFNGTGAPRDLTAAAGWFEKAANAGHTESYARLGALYQAPRADGSKPDYDAAFAWDQRGAALNDAQSFYQLGTLYAGGLGRPVDFVQAETNFLRAGELGNARAFHELGLMAERGRGHPIDFAKAVAFYQRAANLNYAPAMVRLGILTQSGSGTTKDDAAALVDFTKALQLGETQAFWYAAVLTDAGRGGPKNPDRVADYLLSAVKAHQPQAVAAFNGDMATFSLETRIALQRRLQARGLLKTATADGTYDAATREAVLAFAQQSTD